MLDSVILARDRWLNPGLFLPASWTYSEIWLKWQHMTLMHMSLQGGALWPSHADIVIGAACCEEEHQKAKQERVDVMEHWEVRVILNARVAFFLNAGVALFHAVEEC